MDEDSRSETTMVLHFAYGTIVGAVYAPLAAEAPGPPPLKGMAFGVLIWVLSYLGWLPMTGLLSSATRHPAERNGLMITAHLVWGTVIAAITDMMSGNSMRRNEET